MKLRYRWWLPLWWILLTALLTGSGLPIFQDSERVRTFTRAFEYDFVEWTIDAVFLKLTQATLGGGSYLPLSDQPDVVRDYTNLVRQIIQHEYSLSQALSTKTPETDANVIALRSNLETLNHQRSQIQPLAESILQNQVASVAAELGLVVMGQSVPPVLFHVTPPPSALIISPRYVIRMDHDISVQPDLNIQEEAAIESLVEKNLDVSALVVGVGGIGTYPSMIMQTSNLNWLAETVAHEWVHNYLTLRPLGISYMNSPALRTMNETTASIAGKEIGAIVIERYYPELVPPPDTSAPEDPKPATIPEPPAFNFQKEMHITRVTADSLLSEGKIEEAEGYMEARRQIFLENGYLIRRINQAYFAFYGAYADTPGGAAGSDPVGAAVRQLRQYSPNLRAFIQRIGWIWTYEQLQKAVEDTSAAPR